MATAHKIHISPENTGLWGVKQTDEVANKVSELLQKDLEVNHVYFNDRGFHNHIVHHLLALFGTGADAEAIQKGFDGNLGYQRPARSTHKNVVEDLFQTWSHASKYLGKDQYYPDFLAFFQREIERKGWEAVVSEYLFSGTEGAEDLLVRLYAGVLHPLLQLMYAMEWKQPAIVAEALAQTCVHHANLKEELFEAETRANEIYGRAPGARMPSIASLLREVREQPKLGKELKWDDGYSFRNTVFDRAGEEMLEIMSKVKVRPDEVEERTAEMFDAIMFMAAGASFHAHKVNKFDFFIIHHLNSAPAYLTINSQSWISAETKARLLEWKIRYDLMEYAARAVPELSLDQIKGYQPRTQSSLSVADVASKIHPMPDDGHAIKLARAVGVCEELTKKYQDRDWVLIKGDDVWAKIHHLVLDSLQSPGEYWVRSAGLDEAWTEVPKL
ncbi:HypA protein [Diaporthe sp. PMI_573]|nr:HypA protein [Diaporthaceae sp. PMI_573]